MIALGDERGVLSTFWDEVAQTIDFATAGDVLEDAMLPHGIIDRTILLRWYQDRGREKRFSHEDVMGLFAMPGGRKVDSIARPLPDAPGTTMYDVRVSAAQR